MISNDEMQMKVAELRQSILDAHPNLPTLSRDIHSALKADPDNVTLLSEDDICTIVQGLQKQTQVTITASAVKKATGKGKSSSAKLLDSLGL